MFSASFHLNFVSGASQVFSMSFHLTWSQGPRLSFRVVPLDFVPGAMLISFMFHHLLSWATLVFHVPSFTVRGHNFLFHSCSIRFFHRGHSGLFRVIPLEFGLRGHARLFRVTSLTLRGHAGLFHFVPSDLVPGPTPVFSTSFPLILVSGATLVFSKAFGTDEGGGQSRI